MNKFWAKVRFKQEKNAEYLIRAFFKDFNAESSITVRGEEAKLEIVFRQPPMAIIEAIGYCEIVELNYGKVLKAYEEDDTKQTSVKAENPEIIVQPKKKRGRPAKEKVTTNIVKEESKPIEIPELKEIAENATSFENFVKLVAEWLEMDRRQEFFEKLVIISTEVDKLTWKELEKSLKEKGVIYKQGDRNWITKQVSERFKADSVTMLPFLNAIGRYKTYSFEKHSEKVTSTKQEMVETSLNVETETVNESIIPNLRVKMECMPEIKEFEETLANVDKTQTVDERVKVVLNAMGLNKLPTREQNQIVKIASTAVKKERMNYDIIFLEANIPIEQTMEVRMTFAKFVNDFVQKYERGRKVKLLTFLSELQKIIMFESEIQSFSDFTE